MSTNFKLFFGVLLIAAALLTPPDVVANVMTGAAGLVLLGTVSAPAPLMLAPYADRAPIVVHSAAPIEPAWSVFELDQGGGVVVFREVGGKIVSRFYRAPPC